MATDIRVPTLGESVSEATIGKWFKKPGDAVTADEPLVELETDKVTLEVNAPASGILSEISAKDGETVGVGALLGAITEGAAGVAAAPKAAEVPKAAATPSVSAPADHGPAVARLAAETGIDPANVAASGKDGRVTKGDMLAAQAAPAVIPAPIAPVAVRAPSAPADGTREERVRMTKLRQTIARRLKDAQNTAAMLTTFNEVDMTALMGLRARHKEGFQKQYGVGLGISSFFVKASVAALREFPQINAEIQGEEIVLKHYYDIGVAVGAEGGLVVPVLRDADTMSFAQIELAVRDFAKRAGDGTLTLADLTGGTFTITNGGVFGSLLSTPILNPPQVGILGLHKIQDRAVPVDGQVVIRPMMYLALTYDHRIVDGREAVQFLVKLKNYIEDPGYLMLES